jgi:hypothetical protein
MARILRDYRLETRSARERLRVQGDPTSVVPPAPHLGRRRLATADDFADADGKEVLSYSQAAAAAREMAQELAEAPRAPYTVRQAVAEYPVDYEARGGKALRELRR